MIIDRNVYNAVYKMLRSMRQGKIHTVGYRQKITTAFELSGFIIHTKHCTIDVNFRSEKVNG